MWTTTSADPQSPQNLERHCSLGPIESLRESLRPKRRIACRDCRPRRRGCGRDRLVVGEGPERSASGAAGGSTFTTSAPSPASSRPQYSAESSPNSSTRTPSRAPGSIDASTRFVAKRPGSRQRRVPRIRLENIVGVLAEKRRPAVDRATGVGRGRATS